MQPKTEQILPDMQCEEFYFYKLKYASIPNIAERAKAYAQEFPAFKAKFYEGDWVVAGQTLEVLVLSVEEFLQSNPKGSTSRVSWIQRSARPGMDIESVIGGGGPSGMCASQGGNGGLTRRVSHTWQLSQGGGGMSRREEVQDLAGASKKSWQQHTMEGKRIKGGSTMQQSQGGIGLGNANVMRPGGGNPLLQGHAATARGPQQLQGSYYGPSQYGNRDQLQWSQASSQPGLQQQASQGSRSSLPQMSSSSSYGQSTIKNSSQQPLPIALGGSRAQASQSGRTVAHQTGPPPGGMGQRTVASPNQGEASQRSSVGRAERSQRAIQPQGGNMSQMGNWSESTSRNQPSQRGSFNDNQTPQSSSRADPNNQFQGSVSQSQGNQSQRRGSQSQTSQATRSSASQGNLNMQNTVNALLQSNPLSYNPTQSGSYYEGPQYSPQESAMPGSVEQTIGREPVPGHDLSASVVGRSVPRPGETSQISSASSASKRR